MIKRGKFYAPPPSDGKDIKQLFAYAVEKGIGQPVDEEGVPKDQWTPEALADAISMIDHADASANIRTVQYWFDTTNDRNISPNNCRWLARIFGCGDPDAISDWQTALLAARRLFLEKRSKKIETTTLTTGDGEPRSYQTTEPNPSPLASAEKPRRFSIARQTEAMFSSESSLTLPLVVFTGACALALIAFGLNIHSVVYSPPSGIPRQVGFLWAPNWTIVFLAVLPMFLAYLIELLRCWKEEWRPRLLIVPRSPMDVRSWDRGVVKARHSFWVVFFVTVIVASGYNWIATHLIPLLDGDPGRWPIDWGRIAIVQPELVSIPATITFSGLVFLYNGFTAYLFFTGHVFLHLLKNDFALIAKELELQDARGSEHNIQFVAVTLMNGIFRCTALGIVITLMMKLQSAFLQSGSTNIVEWLRADFLTALGQDVTVIRGTEATSIPPGYVYSFLCVLAIVGTFGSAQARIRYELGRLNISPKGKWRTPWSDMNIAMTLLVLSYFAIGLVPGFSILVLLTLTLTVYLVSKPVRREPLVLA